ncbi:alpha/beta fold hydrolase [Pseudonocardia sp. GCM10023141]|uniref:alpha/beta fold hydrolase n=1 Tax=Pseudonocardia sp. GCM10023141 TaxID=3252653 RepID=UPI0036073C50
MLTFAAADETMLAYRVTGVGEPLLVLPGGPMRDAAYLGDLGGLGSRRTLHVLDPRGTGASARSAEPASYRCDRQVADVEAFREHLGLERVDVLAHSAAANLAVLYAARHPERVGALALITPNLAALGVDVPVADRRAVAAARAHEPWAAAAMAGLEALAAGELAPQHWAATTPLQYGRWDRVAQAHAAAEDAQAHPDLAAQFFAPGVFDPAATAAAVATFTAPVLVLAGELDSGPTPVAAATIARFFPDAVVAVQDGGGHFPWLDDPSAFVRVVAGFLG